MWCKLTLLTSQLLFSYGRLTTANHDWSLSSWLIDRSFSWLTDWLINWLTCSLDYSSAAYYYLLEHWSMHCQATTHFTGWPPCLMVFVCCWVKHQTCWSLKVFGHLVWWCWMLLHGVSNMLNGVWSSLTSQNFYVDSTQFWISQWCWMISCLCLKASKY